MDLGNSFFKITLFTEVSYGPTKKSLNIFIFLIWIRRPNEHDNLIQMNLRPIINRFNNVGSPVQLCIICNLSYWVWLDLPFDAILIPVHETICFSYTNGYYSNMTSRSYGSHLLLFRILICFLVYWNWSWWKH